MSDSGVSRLELVFAYRRGRTVIAHAYADAPLRAGRLLDAGPIAQMILVCCGPGIFAGDRFVQRVRVEAGARVLLISQAALQVHPGHASGPAAIDSCYEIADDATLDCFWDPVIPFAGSRLRQRVDLQVASGGHLYWSDALMPGRVARREAWQFEALDHELQLHVGGSLAYVERYGLGRGRNPAHAWSAAGAHGLGTTIVRTEAATAVRAEIAQQRLAAIDGTRAGVDAPVPHLVVARLLANHGPQFTSARLLLRKLFDRPAVRRG
jgi:urease accessory protein UreH